MICGPLSDGFYDGIWPPSTFLQMFLLKNTGHPKFSFFSSNFWAITVLFSMLISGPQTASLERGLGGDRHRKGSGHQLWNCVLTCRKVCFSAGMLYWPSFENPKALSWPCPILTVSETGVAVQDPFSVHFSAVRLTMYAFHGFVCGLSFVMILRLALHTMFLHFWYISSYFHHHHHHHHHHHIFIHLLLHFSFLFFSFVESSQP